LRGMGWVCYSVQYKLPIAAALGRGVIGTCSVHELTYEEIYIQL